MSKPKLDMIPIDERVCDLCNQSVTDWSHTVIRSFVLTDWGAICVDCWDNRIERFDEIRIMQIYLKSTEVRDEWVGRPLIYLSRASDGESNPTPTPSGHPPSDGPWP